MMCSVSNYISKFISWDSNIISRFVNFTLSSTRVRRSGRVFRKRSSRRLDESTASLRTSLVAVDREDSNCVDDVEFHRRKTQADATTLLQIRRRGAEDEFEPILVDIHDPFRRSSDRDGRAKTYDREMFGHREPAGPSRKKGTQNDGARSIAAQSRSFAARWV